MRAFSGSHLQSGSIGCNLADPGIPRSFAVLRGLRDRAEAGDVWVEISEVLSETERPFADHVYVITSASAQQAKAWTGKPQHDGSGSRWWNGPQPGRFPLPAGRHVVTLWWD